MLSVCTKPPFGVIQCSVQLWMIGIGMSRSTMAIIL